MLSQSLRCLAIAAAIWLIVPLSVHAQGSSTVTRSLQYTQLQSDINAARAVLQTKRDELLRWNLQDQANFAAVFGIATPEDRMMILTRIDRSLAILVQFTPNNLVEAPQSKPGRFAWVNVNDPTRIYLDQAYYSARPNGINSRPGVLLHEISHFLGTRDVQMPGMARDELAYGLERTQSLARNNPNLALQNADNFEYYLEGAARAAPQRSPLAYSAPAVQPLRQQTPASSSSESYPYQIRQPGSGPTPSRSPTPMIPARNPPAIGAPPAPPPVLGTPIPGSTITRSQGYLLLQDQTRQPGSGPTPSRSPAPMIPARNPPAIGAPPAPPPVLGTPVPGSTITRRPAPWVDLSPLTVTNSAPAVQPLRQQTPASSSSQGYQTRQPGSGPTPSRSPAPMIPARNPPAIGAPPPAPPPAIELAGSSFAGQENLRGYSNLQFRFFGNGQAQMIDTQGSHNGTWQRSGNQVTLRFFSNCIYTGTIQGNRISGSARVGNESWTWSVSR